MSISVENLVHLYHKGTPLQVSALNGVSMEIPQGSWISIVGHTGSGKSTLAQHMNALLLPDSGEVRVDGLSVRSKKDLRSIRRKVGLVFQYPEQQLFAETVSRELAFGPENWGMKIDRTFLMDILAQVGLSGDYLDRSPFKLSGGERRRVAIASVLAARPSYLVLDEPTAGLDAQGRRLLTDLLKRIHKSGTAIVMVTHDMDMAMELSQRIFVLQMGRVAYSGSPMEMALALDEKPIPGLVLPDIARLWVELRKRGMKIAFTASPAVMADRIRAKKRGSKA